MITLYCVHQDTDCGVEFKVFGTKLEVDAYCDNLIRAKGNQANIEILNQDGLSDAWPLFCEESNERDNYYARYDREIELPEPYASGPELLLLCKAELKDWESQNYLLPSERDRVLRLRHVIGLAERSETCTQEPK